MRGFEKWHVAALTVQTMSGRIVRSPVNYFGNANATSESPSFVPNFP